MLKHKHPRDNKASSSDSDIEKMENKPVSIGK